MRKTILFIAILLAAEAAFGQEFTFQGLTWGSTREQVIERFGNPITIDMDRNIILYNNVNIGRYIAKLEIEFLNHGMIGAIFSIHRANRLIYDDLKNQLETKYGRPTAIKEYSNQNLLTDGLLFTVWRFDDFNIFLEIIIDGWLNLGYFNDKYYEDYVGWDVDMYRLGHLFDF